MMAKKEINIHNRSIKNAPTICEIENRLKRAKECIDDSHPAKAKRYISSAWYSLRQLKEKLEGLIDDIDNLNDEAQNCVDDMSRNLVEDSFCSPPDPCMRGIFSVCDEMRELLMAREEYAEQYKKASND